MTTMLEKAVHEADVLLREKLGDNHGIDVRELVVTAISAAYEPDQPVREAAKNQWSSLLPDATRCQLAAEVWRSMMRAMLKEAGFQSLTQNEGISPPVTQDEIGRWEVYGKDGKVSNYAILRQGGAVDRPTKYRAE